MRQPAARMTARRRAQRLFRPAGTIAAVLSPPLLTMHVDTVKPEGASQDWCGTLYQWLAPTACRPRRR